MLKSQVQMPQDATIFVCVLKVESFQSALILRTISKMKRERMAIPLAKCIAGGRRSRWITKQRKRMTKVEIQA